MRRKRRYNWNTPLRGRELRKFVVNTFVTVNASIAILFAGVALLVWIFA